MGYLVAVAAFGLWAVLKKKMGGRIAMRLWFVPPALLLIGSASLANTGLGAWIAGALAAVIGWPAGMVGVSATAAIVVVGLLLLAATVFDLKDRNADGVAKTGLILLPILAIAASGPLADGGANLFDQVANAGTNGLTSLIGG